LTGLREIAMDVAMMRMSTFDRLSAADAIDLAFLDGAKQFRPAGAHPFPLISSSSSVRHWLPRTCRRGARWRR
jgi:hypothetical protein